MRISFRSFVAALCLLVGLPPTFGAARRPTVVADPSFLVYVGTYPGPKSNGIYSFRFDSALGTPSSSVAVLAAVSPTPSSLALHPSGDFLYAANELSSYGGRSSGSVSAFAIREGGRLELLNVQASGGPGPCYVSVDPSGRCALVAHYNGGSVSTLPIGPDGRLGAVATFIQHTGSSVDPQRQTHAYAHWIATDAADRYALVCDLGLDKVFTYRFDAAKASLEADVPPFVAVAPGSGPRHLAFHPNGRWVYVINEMGNTMVVFTYDDVVGALHQTQSISTLPPDFTGTSAGAEVAVHPNGKFVYGSNRGHNSIVVYAVDAASGNLTPLEYPATRGQTPRHFALDPTGQWLLVANQDSDAIAVFRVDGDSGRLTPTESRIEVGSPSFIAFVRVR